MVHQSCSLYDSSMPYCKASVDLIKCCNSPHMESFWTQSSSTTFGMLRAMALEKLDNTAFTTGEYVSNLAPVDRHRKCIRFKSASEYPHNSCQCHWRYRLSCQLNLINLQNKVLYFSNAIFCESKWGCTGNYFYEPFKNGDPWHSQRLKWSLGTPTI